MSTLFAVAALAFFVAFFAALIGLFFKRIRRKSAYGMAGAFVLFVGSAMAFGHYDEVEAISEGWKSGAERQAALAANVTDPVAWETERPRREAAAREAAEKEKANAEAKLVEAARINAEAEAKAKADADARLAEEAAKLAEAERLKTEAEQKVKAEAEAKDQMCRKDLRCWADKNWVRGITFCQFAVERLALNNFEWYDSFMDGKFSAYRWKNKTKGIVTYIGDKIKFQNGFGAWIIHTYECDFDPATDAVLDVRARPGRV